MPLLWPLTKVASAGVAGSFNNSPNHTTPNGNHNGVGNSWLCCLLLYHVCLASPTGPAQGVCLLSVHTPSCHWPAPYSAQVGVCSADRTRYPCATPNHDTQALPCTTPRHVFSMCTLHAVRMWPMDLSCKACRNHTQHTLICPSAYAGAHLPAHLPYSARHDIACMLLQSICPLPASDEPAPQP